MAGLTDCLARVPATMQALVGFFVARGLIFPGYLVLFEEEVGLASGEWRG